MDFVTSHFGKRTSDQLNTFFNIFVIKIRFSSKQRLERIRFSSNQNIGEGESNFVDKYVEKSVNWSEVHLSEMTCYKIHTLVFALNCSHFYQSEKVFKDLNRVEGFNSMHWHT